MIEIGLTEYSIILYLKVHPTHDSSTEFMIEFDRIYFSWYIFVTKSMATELLRF